MSDFHDFQNRVWVKDRLRVAPVRNSFRWGGGSAIQFIPANTFIPIISGTPTQGHALTTTTGSWTQSPTSFSYQWLRGETPITGATSVNYTLTATDVGQMITVAVVATNVIGNSFPVDAKPVGPIAANPAELDFSKASNSQYLGAI